MRTLIHILRKEFTQVLRDRQMLVLILMVPIMQMLILVYAANFDIKNVDVVVVDNDMSDYSRQLVSKFNGSTFFKIRGVTFNEKEAESFLFSNKADMILKIPHGFETNLYRENKTSIQLLFNAINGTSAEVASGYAQNMIYSFHKNIATEIMKVPKMEIPGEIRSSVRFWYNPELDYKHFMAPGILVILVTVIGMFLSGMNLVKEKERGTIEQLNVTPIKKYQLIAGKLIPFWVIGLVDLGFGLIITKLLFNMPMVGSLFTVFGFASLYLIGILAGGLLISTFAETQQQVLFIGFFFMMVFVLMGGIFTSVESMPYWAQLINTFNPVCYFMEVIRMVLLKGSSVKNILPQIYFTSIFGVVMLSLAVFKYRKRA